MEWAPASVVRWLFDSEHGASDRLISRWLFLRALGLTSWQVRGTVCWQALTLAGMALVIGVPAGVVCGRLCWQVAAHQLGITPAVAVPLVVLAVMAAGWLAAAAVVAVLPAAAAARNPPARALRSE